MNSSLQQLNGKILTTLVVAALSAAMGNADAAMITIETGHSTAGAQASAEAYRNVVDAAVVAATPGYGTSHPALFDNVSNHGLFGDTTQDIAFRFTINFGVSAAQAGIWDFRAGVDFGRGGAMFLDGVALGFNSSDMWWDGSYGNSNQYLGFASTAPLAAGNHVLNIYGLEGCCDGGEQVQYRLPGSDNFNTFGATTLGSIDSLSAVPEPATYALFGIGLLGLSMARRRKG